MEKVSLMLRTVCIFATVFIFSYCKQEVGEIIKPSISFTFTHQIITRPPIGVNLGWSKISNSDEYILHRSINTMDNYTEIISTALTSYTDTEVSWNTKYYYKLSAKRSGTEIYVSGNFQVLLPPEPTGLTSSDAIWLNSSLTDYSFSEGVNMIWFKFSGGGNTLRIRDRVFYGYTSDVVIDILTYSNNNLVIITIDGKRQENIDTSTIHAFNWLGLYYVRVKPKDNDVANKGTFAICFN
jgi:hypothetical protein